MLGRAAELVAEAREHSTPLATLWIGIDRFRQINESFGHAVGDRVLSVLARRWREHFAWIGDWGRVGGDEFLLLLPGHDQHAAEEVATRILEVLSLPIDMADLRLRPSASIGIALLHPEQDAGALVETADRTMREAKEAGRGRWLLEGELQRRGRTGRLLAREELGVEELIHDALESGGLSLHYQPLITVPGGELEAVEALMRCQVRGITLPPAQLIPVAEKTGLIVRLGEWTLLTAARFAQGHRQQSNPLKVAVNVSRHQVASPRFSQVLHGALLCSDVPPQLIELELTESLFMDASATVRRNLHLACEAGFRLAIDDFGTGYSCLAYLKDLPASKLKLDRAFARDLPQDRKSLAVVRTMAQLGRDLGMTVVAEGVESTEQLDCLLEAGVEVIQGHLLARAMPETELAEWIKKRSDQSEG